MRIFKANLNGGQVFINGVIPVIGATILGAGVANSTGVLLLAGDECVYIPQSTPDISQALKILSDGFTQLSKDVIVASGGASDLGGATPQFQLHMTQVATQLQTLAGMLT